jgi:LAO/AO transport system kinase
MPEQSAITQTSSLARDLKDIGKLVARMRTGERLATSRVVTELERLSDVAPQLLAALEPYLGHALVVGFTGPPGVGKSTLVNAVIAEARRNGTSVGVIAVDPSSPISGGAILGDRLRMTAMLNDDGVFMRSLASRGHVGGLSPAAVRVIDALDAAGKDLVLVETVGAGQAEVDVAEVTDVRVVVSAPGLGDDIQAMKSGLLEIADILVVNKADRADADVTMQQLAGAVAVRAHEGSGVPVLKTIATTGEGVGELLQTIQNAGSKALAEDVQRRRRRRARYLIAHAATKLLEERLGSASPALDELCDEVLRAGVSPGEAARRLLQG